MTALTKLKVFLIIIAIILGIWNYFLRGILSLPILSNLSSFIVWLIVIAIIIATIIINWSIGD